MVLLVYKKRFIAEVIEPNPEQCSVVVSDCDDGSTHQSLATCQSGASNHPDSSLCWMMGGWGLAQRPGRAWNRHGIESNRANAS